MAGTPAGREATSMPAEYLTLRECGGPDDIDGEIDARAIDIQGKER